LKWSVLLTSSHNGNGTSYVKEWRSSNRPQTMTLVISVTDSIFSGNGGRYHYRSSIEGQMLYEEDDRSSVAFGNQDLTNPPHGVLLSRCWWQTAMAFLMDFGQLPGVRPSTGITVIQDGKIRAMLFFRQIRLCPRRQWMEKDPAGHLAQSRGRPLGLEHRSWLGPTGSVQPQRFRGLPLGLRPGQGLGPTRQSNIPSDHS